MDQEARGTRAAQEEAVKRNLLYDPAYDLRSDGVKRAKPDAEARLIEAIGVLTAMPPNPLNAKNKQWWQIVRRRLRALLRERAEAAVTAVGLAHDGVSPTLAAAIRAAVMGRRKK